MLPGGYWQPQKWKIFETVSKAAKQKSSFACSVLPMIADLFTRWRGLEGGGGGRRGEGGAAERESVRTEVGGEVSSRYVIAYCGLNQRRMFVCFTF